MIEAYPEAFEKVFGYDEAFPKRKLQIYRVNLTLLSSSSAIVVNN